MSCPTIKESVPIADLTFTPEIRFAPVTRGTARPFVFKRANLGKIRACPRILSHTKLIIAPGDDEGSGKRKKKKRRDKNGGWSHGEHAARRRFVTALCAIKDSKHRSFYALWKITRLFGGH